mgnify:FL=1
MGVHVSSAGGWARALARAAALASDALQLFTQPPQRWAAPPWSAQDAAAFVAGRAEHGIAFACGHEIYLANLASEDVALRARSRAYLEEELRRARALGLEGVVIHPGRIGDGLRDEGLGRYADELTVVLAAVPAVRVFLETTPGARGQLGGTLEELAALRDRIPAPLHRRVGYCVDTCHLFVAGYDLVRDFDGVLARIGDVLGWEHVALLHLNDARDPCGSRRDRHAHLGEGALGPDVFRRLLADDRTAWRPKILETPKGKDDALDRHNLARVRRWWAEVRGTLTERSE